MHKDFYASGFLYHPVSEQILLQQRNSLSSTSSPWLLFGGLYLNEEPEAFLKKLLFKLLDIEVPTIHPVYSYTNATSDKDQYIGYSKVRSRKSFSSKNGHTFAWFSFKNVLKLSITEQTKHDIVVGQRVIEAATRKRLGQHTFQ